MNITNLAEGADSFTSNVFLLDNNTLVDAGANAIILDRLKDRVIDRVVITHTHNDHITNLERIVDQFDPVVYAFEPANLPVEAEPITDGDTISLGESNTPFLTIHTPGHKTDSICLYNPDEKILFAGDLIFPHGSFGRTDLEEGDRDTLIESIERVAELDVKELYAGHDEPVTVNVNEQIQASLTEARKHEPKY